METQMVWRNCRTPGSRHLESAMEPRIPGKQPSALFFTLSRASPISFRSSADAASWNVTEVFRKADAD